MTVIVLLVLSIIGLIALHLIVMGHAFLPSALVAFTGATLGFSAFFTNSLTMAVTAVLLAILGGVPLVAICIDVYRSRKGSYTSKHTL